MCLCLTLYHLEENYIYSGPLDWIFTASNSSLNTPFLEVRSRLLLKCTKCLTLSSTCCPAVVYSYSTLYLVCTFAKYKYFNLIGGCDKELPPSKPTPPKAVRALWAESHSVMEQVHPQDGLYVFFLRWKSIPLPITLIHIPAFLIYVILFSFSFILSSVYCPSYCIIKSVHSHFRLMDYTRLYQIATSHSLSEGVVLHAWIGRCSQDRVSASSNLLPLRANWGATVCSSVWLSHQRMSMKAWL